MDSEIDKRIECATFTCDSVNCDLCRSLLQRIMAVDIGLQTGIVNARSPARTRSLFLTLFWVFIKRRV